MVSVEGEYFGVYLMIISNNVRAYLELTMQIIIHHEWLTESEVEL